MAEATERRSELNVAPGLYVLRYLSSADLRSAPSARVEPAEDAASDVDLIVPPGVAVGDMPGPGSNAVILARRSSKLVVVVSAIPGSSNLDARFTLDMLGGAVETQGRAGERSSPDTAAAFGLEVSAHVARRGDVAADGEGWIGGPRMPSAIEGVTLRLSGADLGVAAQYCNAAEPGRWSAWVTPGSLIGTRQKASALTGLRLKLVGSDAPRYEMAIEALFLGSPIEARNGSEVEVTSAGGRDALVGLRVEVKSKVDNIVERKPSRIKVFR